MYAVATYHTYDSRRSNPGFPDLVLVGCNGVLYRELKTDRGRLTPMQEWWLNSLLDAGQDAGVWRPSDWPDTILAALQGLGGVLVRPPPPDAAAVRKSLQRGRHDAGRYRETQ